MTREKIYRSTEYEINPETMETGDEVWENVDCAPFWNEYYRVAIWDTDEWEYNHEALCNDGYDFYNFQEAKAKYDELKGQLETEE